MTRIVKALFFATALLSVAVSPGRGAQLALVDQDVGHALLFKHRGNCFAVLPSHVAERDRFSLQLPLQGLIGAGAVFLRDEGLDLALAFVDGDINSACTDDWAGLQSNLNRVLETRRDGEILRLSPEGIRDRTAAKIHTVTPDFVVVRTSDGLAEGAIYKGSSGSALVIGDIVVGIAQRAPSGREAVFFRMDEIARRIGSDLSLKGFLQADGRKSRGVTGWSGKTVGAAEPARGLLSQAYVAEWTGEPLQLEITLDPAKAVPLNRLVLGASPAAHADQSPPKTVLMQVDVGAPGAAFWRDVGMLDMTPAGELKWETGGVFARRVRVTLASIWFVDRPRVRLDRLEVE